MRVCLRAHNRRRRLEVLAALVLLAGLAGASYSLAAAASPRIAGGPIPRAAAAACTRPVTPVGHTHDVNNTRFLANVGWIGGIVVSLGWGPTKTVFEPYWQGHVARAVLRGWRCSDGRPLRFWFRNADLPWSGRGSQYELATTGSLRLPFALARLRASHLFTVGAVLFSSPGKWVIEAQEGHRVLGTVLLDFPGG